MGRSKKNKKRAAREPHGSIQITKEEKDINSLIDDAEAAIDSFNYEEALEKLNEVLALDAINTKSLEMLAGIHLEQSGWLEAQNLLKKCIELEPDIGHSKYFSMAQIHEGQESLAFYQKGIQILEKNLENAENLEPTKESSRIPLTRTLSDAYCSISELYMTDFCFEENAEDKCCAAIEASIKSDPSNPEAHQCQANFLLTKGQTEEAIEAMKSSLGLWLPQHEALRDGETVAISKEEIVIPTYDSRVQTSKLLIELEMYDEATKILDGLTEEDDEVAEVWYLLGWMNYIQGEEYKINAHFYLDKAKKVCTKTGIEESEFDYVSHISELLEELKVSHPLDEEENDEADGSDIASDSEDEKMET